MSRSRRKTAGKQVPSSFLTLRVQGGTVVGATDEFGDRAVGERRHLRDVHATLLHLLGLDQEKLTYYHAGRFKRLTNTGGTVIRGLLKT